MLLYKRKHTNSKILLILTFYTFMLNLVWNVTKTLHLVCWIYFLNMSLILWWIVHDSIRQLSVSPV